MVRLAGLPYDRMEELALQNTKSLHTFYDQFRTCKALKVTLLGLLEKSPEQLHCGFMLKNLYHLKIDLQKGRKLSISPKLDQNLLAKERPFFQHLLEKITAYQESKKKLESARKRFASNFQTELNQSRQKLQQFSGAEVFKKGLLMASLVLESQIEKYRKKPIIDFRKKEYQTERTVLQYLSRICAKTSPFSTFTSLGIFHLQEKESLIKEPVTVLRLNNYLFASWRDMLNNYPPFFQNMPLGLNPSLKKEGKDWVYLFNSRNVESVQKMETNDLLEFIVEQFSGLNKNIVFSRLVDELMEAVEADRQMIESLLLELVAYEFLEWRWPFSGLDQNWDGKLNMLLQSYQNDVLLARFRQVLNQIEGIKNTYPASNSLVRKGLLLKAHTLCKKFSEELLKESQIVENQQNINFESLQHFKADRFELPPERLFYEDTALAFQPVWNEKDLEPVIRDLDSLISAVSTLNFNDRKAKALDCFQQNFSPDSSVDLFTFYETFYQSERQADHKSRQLMIEKQLSWQSAIFAHFQVNENGILRIDPQYLLELAGTQKKKNETGKSLGSLMHLFSEEQQLKAFTDASFIGYGKMMGRFLHLFPDSVAQALRNWNTRLRGSLLWIENMDASLYNPNLHPPLLPFEIRMPGSQNTLPEEQQISIRELLVRYDKKSEALQLIHRPSGKQAHIFDLGFEAPESRSPMYQLLLVFSVESGSQKVLANIINHRFLQKNKEEIVVLPRIEVGERLIIQRKQWLIPQSELPLKPQAEQESDYFLRVNSWRMENKISTKVFIRLHERIEKGSGKQKDDYKPQYIDFSSPLLVQLFHKSIKKVRERLIVEEVLPFPAENIDGQSFASEYLIQWERG